MIIFWILSQVKYVIRINFAYFFTSAVTRKLKIIYEACSIPLLNSIFLEQWFSNGGDLGHIKCAQIKISLSFIALNLSIITLEV